MVVFLSRCYVELPDFVKDDVLLYFLTCFSWDIDCSQVCSNVCFFSRFSCQLKHGIESSSNSYQGINELILFLLIFLFAILYVIYFLLVELLARQNPFLKYSLKSWMSKNLSRLKRVYDVDDDYYVLVWIVADFKSPFETKARAITVYIQFKRTLIFFFYLHGSIKRLNRHSCDLIR